jgi:hypothetical protein
MNKKVSCFILVILILVTLFFYSKIPSAQADLQVTPLGTFGFAGNDVDSHGVLWAGDKNFNLYKSVDNGASFQLVYRLPGNIDTSNPYSGLVWNVFVDSRDYIFVSAGSTNGLFRSTNGGASFSQVLNTNGTRYESFYIAMTEDDLHNLYTVTYTIGYATPIVLKSADGGTTWNKLGSFSVFHFHNIRFNPSNGYLYLVTGEGSYADSSKIFRSKDRGAT